MQQHEKELLKSFDTKFTILQVWKLLKKPEKNEVFSRILLVKLIFLETLVLFSLMFVFINIIVKENFLYDFMTWIVLILTILTNLYYQYLWNKRVKFNSKKNSEK